jgi:CTP:phosphocholine cytidylyltransferase-like protein
MERNTDSLSKSGFLDAINQIWGFCFSEAEKYFKNEKDTKAVHSYYYAEVNNIVTLKIANNLINDAGTCIARPFD